MELQETLTLCPVCHQPVKPEYYFCPNCGTKLHQPPLSTSVWNQIGIYAFSIILPSIFFIFVTKWPGIKYAKSEDKKARIIGVIAISLLVISTIVTIWLAYYFTQQAVQSSIDSINTDFSGF